MIGTKLAHYEITGHLGTGGMGEVYQATDLKLGRGVAIKLLPEKFTHDTDRAERFEREARVLALLNHPNIAAIHGIDESGGRKFLVMELVPGETLAERIQQGPMPVDEALTIGMQIADGLDAAHEKGIIHRDLKPANVKITPDGQVKVLDFGLAKAYETEAAATNLSNSPTLSMAATQAGLVLGTAAYMSPEQAKGRNVDKRADIWAFGVVLYELVTGKPVFQGEDLTETVAAVLMKEPDLSIVPANLRRLLEKCLQKNPKKRLRDIGDAWDLIERGTAIPAQSEGRSTSKALWLVGATLGIALVTLAGLAFVHFRETAPSQLSGLFSVSLPTMSNLSYLMLSPDGRNLAFISDEGGTTRLWVRPLDSLEARPIPGTDGASFPFWSPDGKNLGFFAQGRLKRIAVGGGPAQTLCNAPTPRGGTWNREGVILFAPNITGALFRVPEKGGVPSPVTRPTASEDSHRYPEFIEAGNRFLFQITTLQPESSGIYAASLDGAAPVRLLPDISHSIYVPPAAGARTGSVLFSRETTTMALPFDAGKLRAAGVAVPVVEDVAVAGLVGFNAFSASENGVLLYRSGNIIPNGNLVWLDRSGKQIESKREAQPFNSLALSPDGKQAAVSIRSRENTEVWLQDLERGVSTKFTFGPGHRHSPLWSPDGSSIVFATSNIPQGLFRKPANSGTIEELLLQPAGNNAYPLDISPDGKLLVYSSTGGNTKDDLWLLPLQGDHKPFKYLNDPSEERHAQFSPDGKWMAYSSNESGQFQVYVQPVPATGAKRQVSTQGGSRPRWRRDGKELYYVSAELKLMAVPVMFGSGTFDRGAPQQLFDRSLPTPNGREIGYQPSADGQKFLALVPAEGTADAQPVTVWMNWTGGLNK